MDIKLKDNAKLSFGSFNQLEYIEGDGLCRISTDIPVNGNTSIMLSLMQIDAFPRNQWLYSCLWGSSTSAYGIGWDKTSDTDRGINAYPGPVVTSFNFPRNERHDIELYYTGGVKLKYDGTLVASGSTGAYIPSGSKFAFSFGGDLPHRYYRVCVKQDGVVVLDLYPTIYNNTVCFYDIVSETHFYNRESGTLIGGKIINTFPDTILKRTTSFFHKNVPNIDGFLLLNNIADAQENDSSIIIDHVRVDIGNVSGSYSELIRYATLHGFNDNYEPQTKPRLVGTWTINDWYTSEQLIEAQSAFDGLTIVADPNYLIDFDELAVQVMDDTKPNYNPAAAVILQAAGYGVTLNVAPVRGQEGRWFITKTQASSLTSIVSFESKVTVQDNNKIVTSSADSYNFTRFLEFQYFTGITTLPDNFCKYTQNLVIVMPDSLTSIRGQGFIIYSKNDIVKFTSELSTANGWYFASVSGLGVIYFPQITPPTFNNAYLIGYGGQLYYKVGPLDKYKSRRAEENWKTVLAGQYIKGVQSNYDYSAPKITYDGTNITITVQRTSDVYYTTDGSIPTTNSTKYTTPFAWDGIGCIKAMAIDTTNIIGDIAYADNFYAATTQNPIISYVHSEISITAESGATIYYTLDGSYPTLESSTYSGPITVTQEMGDFVKVRCFARITGKNDSEIVAKICVIDDSLWGTDGDTSSFAVQCIDSTKPNYNPAVCIILDNNNKLTDKCYGGGGYISKADAAAVTDIGTWFRSKTTITDIDGIVSNNITQTYNFVSFDELKYFTSIATFGSAFEYDSLLESINFPPNAQSTNYYVFAGCSKLSNIILNEGLKSIGIIKSAYLTAINLPSTLTSFGGFSGCSALVLTEVPVGITNYPLAAFQDCKSLVNFTVNENISFGGSVFERCSGLEYIHFLNPTPFSLGNRYTFDGISSKCKFYVGDGSSASHDDAILADYLADSAWSSYSSRLDTWYNYLHPSS